MREPKVLFHIRSYRGVESGGIDASGKWRGVEVQKRKNGRWQTEFFTVDKDGVQGRIRSAILLGKSPRAL